ncbi:hypothetical protein HMPREF3226_00692 [Prevotella corporis]|uniref:Uncharacterized protein n=1 Tax=Prevotella corporis TaxID=28128 RepID=A0A133QHH1_9BACT|nr:hypothetical protein HMPREF3226_00692 [Prevotella corporis]
MINQKIILEQTKESKDYLNVFFATMAFFLSIFPIRMLIDVRITLSDCLPLFYSPQSILYPMKSTEKRNFVAQWH